MDEHMTFNRVGVGSIPICCIQIKYGGEVPLIYFDNSATTSVSPAAAKAAYDVMLNHWGNPDSKYSVGKDAKRIEDEATLAVKEYLGADDGSKVIFTSSGSESNNLALTGLYNWYTANNKKCIVISTPIEHKSILRQPCVQPIIPIDCEGMVDLAGLESLLEQYEYNGKFAVVSVMLASNELGTINSAVAIADVCHKHGAVFHCDATQAIGIAGKDIVKKSGVDMLTFSGHKIHAPKGIGVLYVRSGIDLQPIIYGGQQMYGLRGGTPNTPYMAALTVALKEIDNSDAGKLIQFRTQIVDAITDLGGVMSLGNPYFRIPGHISLAIKGIDGEALMAMLDSDGICISTGSACNSKSVEPSYVMRAIGVPDDYIYGVVRITLGNGTTQNQVNYLIERMKKHIATLRMITRIKNGGV